MAAARDRAVGPTEGYRADMSAHDRSDEPVPYTAPDYDPDGSGRPAATVPDTGREAPETAAGEGSAAGNEPMPYVDPGYDPDKD